MNYSINVDYSTILRHFNEIETEHWWSPFIREGPSHSPLFKIDLFINNVRFHGVGSTKKKAKINAIMNSNCLKFNSEDNNTVVISDIPISNKRKRADSFKEEDPQSKRQALDITNFSTLHTSAVSILHALYPTQNLIYRHEQSHGILETISVNIFGKKYIGYGTNKKEAKEIACRNALKALYETLPADNKFKDQIEMLCTNYDDSKIIDKFAYITDAVYRKLEFNNIKYKEYTVIASIIKVNPFRIG